VLACTYLVTSLWLVLDATVRNGATILFLAPGFYHGAQTVDELVDFVVSRCLDQLGIEHETARWG